MKKVTFIHIILIICGTIVFFSPVFSLGTVSLIIGSDNGAPGESTIIPVTLVNTIAVRALQLKICTNPSEGLSFIGCSIGENPDLDDFMCRSYEEDGCVTVLVLNIGDKIILPGERLIFKLHYEIGHEVSTTDFFHICISVDPDDLIINDQNAMPIEEGVIVGACGKISVAELEDDEDDNGGNGNSGSGGGGSGELPPSPGCITDNDCEEGNVCDVESGRCLACINDTECDDGLFCNGKETCNGNNDCIEGVNPCLEGQICEENGDKCFFICLSDEDCKEGLECDTEIAECVECISNGKCDDGLFCNGKEQCEDGRCINGEEQCDSGQVCREDSDECLDIVTISASCMPEGLYRPLFREKRCPWLLVQTSEKNHFNLQSIITIEGSGEDFRGVDVDLTRSAFKVGKFIFCPICIEKAATEGPWSIKIKTEAETIEASFQIK